ncbi:MAG: helix-turn-helix domain-containing protein [Deferribacterales bacterium]
MQLKEYIKQFHDGNLTDFSRASGVPLMNLSRYTRGGTPSPEYIKKIESVTNGKVSLDDFVNKNKSA